MWERHPRVRQIVELKKGRYSDEYVQKSGGAKCMQQLTEEKKLYFKKQATDYERLFCSLTAL